MKITKSQLKQIIKEELSAVLNETEAPENIIATIASYLMETEETYTGTFEQAAEMVRKMSDDEIAKLYPKARKYFSKQGGSP